MYKLNKSSTAPAVFAAFLLVMGYGSAALALTATPQPSNYATDVQAGQAALQSDPAVAANAKEVNDAESDTGDVDNEPAEVKEAVEPQEATEAAGGGESSGDGGGQEGSGGTNGDTAGGQQ